MNCHSLSASGGTRIPYWDNLKGVLILLVVLGHFLFEFSGGDIANSLMYFVYSFHMPAFILVSGYFSRRPRALGIKAIAELLAAFLLVNFVMMFYGVLFHGERCDLAHLYYSSWYLLALALYRATLPLCSRIPGILPVSLAVSLLIGLWDDLDDVFRLSKVVALYPFFLIGLKLPDNFSKLVLSRFTIRKACLATLLFISVAVLIAFLIHVGWIDFDKVFWVHYGMKRELLERGAFFALVVVTIASLMLVTPVRSLGLLAQWGRNSLAIYLFHRPVVAAIRHYAATPPNPWLSVTLMVAATMVLLFVFGSNPVSKLLKKTLAWVTGGDGTGLAAPPRQRFSMKWVGMLVLPLFMLGVLSSKGIYSYYKKMTAEEPLDPIYPVLSCSEKELLEDAVKIGFVGDLILLRDQVMRAYNTESNSYDFDPLFVHAAKYLSAPDVTLGVLEGPLAGARCGYTSSNFDDGLPLALNFPDEWIEAIQKAGIDFVTLANNHLLDHGEQGVMRTIDKLQRPLRNGKKLQFSGAYRSPEEKEAGHLFRMRVRGLNLVILTYTYGSNGVGDSYFMDPKTSFITSWLAAPGSVYFEQCKKSVFEDLSKARALQPDCIIVMPHMGEQFKHAPDKFQETWCRIFAEGGADIVFSDHPHAVQPIEWLKGSGKSVMLVHCPGNFVNSYTPLDGDAGAMVTAYLDPETGKPVAASVVPLWTHCPLNGMHRALPIHDAMKDPQLNSTLSLGDFGRMSEVHELITSVMLGHKLSIDQSQEQYYLFPYGYVRNAVDGVELTEVMRRSALFQLLQESSSVCFIGDSITEGTRNGGYGWYEPMMALFPHCRVHRRAWGAYTAKMVHEEKVHEIGRIDADTYVLALGTNDVRYRNPDMCAMTPEEYARAIDGIVSALQKKNSDARFVLIGAWCTDEYDPISAGSLSREERETLMAQYREALKSYAERHGFLYIDPNSFIALQLRGKWTGYYLKDSIHPNASEGIRLYSRAVLECSPPGKPEKAKTHAKSAGASRREPQGTVVEGAGALE